MLTNEDDKDGHFFFNHPEREGYFAALARAASVTSVLIKPSVFACGNLILDRSRKLVGLQSPAACATRAGGDSDPNFKNYGGAK